MGCKMFSQAELYLHTVCVTMWLQNIAYVYGNKGHEHDVMVELRDLQQVRILLFWVARYINRTVKICRTTPMFLLLKAHLEYICGRNLFNTKHVKVLLY